MYKTVGTTVFERVRDLALKSAGAGLVQLPQAASDENFKRNTAETIAWDTGGVAHPPRPQDEQTSLVNQHGTYAPSFNYSYSNTLDALKKESMNNFWMSAITTGVYTGASYGIDKIPVFGGKPLASTITAPPLATATAVAVAEKKVEAAEKKVEALEKEFVKVEEKVATATTPAAEKAAEKKVEEVKKKIDKAEEIVMKTSAKAPLKTSSTPIGIISNATSQFAISMGVRTLATAAGSTSVVFQKNLKYIVPPSSGILRGVVDYYLFGKPIGRCAINAALVAGTEFASTGIVKGFK